MCRLLRLARRFSLSTEFLFQQRKMNTGMNVSDFLAMTRSILPDLVHSLHKGEMGRIGVIGGCKEYTGAPYFAALSALKVGCDLSHVFCASDAATVIKSYSPELIVHPILDSRDSLKEVEQWFPRLHSVVLGPGLGRDENVFETVKGALEKALHLDIPIVIDADGLFYVTLHPEFVKGHEKVTLTPNAIEFSRLFQVVVGREPSQKELSKEVMLLSGQLGNVTIVRKGEEDIISNGTNYVVCSHEGSARRCGGQGDLLSGSLGVWLYWSYMANGRPNKHHLLATYGPSLCAAYAACWLTRECNRLAFAKNRRSMTTTDMIEEIKNAMIYLEIDSK